MRSLLAAAALSLWPSRALAQPTPPASETKHALYVELGGPAVVYAIHVERIDGPVTVRVGASQYALSASQTLPDGRERTRTLRYVLLPVGASYLLFQGPSHLELGANLTFAYVSDRGDPAGTPPADSGVYVTPSLLAGYRYQHPGGFLLRASLDPLLINGSPRLWAGVSVGAAF